MSEPALVVRWISRLLDSDASPSERLVALILFFHMMPHGICRGLPVSTIASETGLSRSTVKRALRSLERKGWLLVGFRSGEASTYRCTWANLD